MLVNMGRSPVAPDVLRRAERVVRDVGRLHAMPPDGAGQAAERSLMGSGSGTAPVANGPAGVAMDIRASSSDAARPQLPGASVGAGATPGARIWGGAETDVRRP